MIPYHPPVRDMAFALRHAAGFDRVAGLPGCEEVSEDLIEAVLEEAAKLASDVIAPINSAGDRDRAVLENGVVRTAPGFREAYAAYVEGGWNSVPFDPDYGGQGLPWSLAMPVAEMWQSASMAFALCPMLNQGAVEAIAEHGSQDQKQTWLPKMISGEWTGTMNLTEPQAGSDLSAVRARAVPDGDAYRITGQKIYITYGEHDFTANIIHLVLARLPDAPEGVKGISLFIVPKFLLNEDGSLGARNDLRCVSLEHKLGIHGSPTAVMSYGDDGGALGYLVGEPHQGLKYMFTMMNNARLTVGLQGVAIAERAYQQAVEYARQRVQGRGFASGDERVAIIEHPDVRRMLMTMRAFTEAGRAMAYKAFAAVDIAKRHDDPAVRKAAAAKTDLLTPIVKSWCTDRGVEVASLGVQVHGGMGYIEETGAAQHYRDARIAPIYEGTNGIQAGDLVFRKTLRDGGAAARALIAEMRETLPRLTGHEDLQVIGAALEDALSATEQAVSAILAAAEAGPDAPAHASAAYLKLFGNCIGGWCLAVEALAAAGLPDDDGFARTKRATARFYAEQILPETGSLARSVAGSQAAALALSADQF